MTRRCTMASLAFGSMLTVLLGCGDSPTEATGSVGFETVLKATLPGDVFAFPGEETVRDQARWQALWTDLHQGTPPPLPELDFSREMLVVVVGRGCGATVDISAIDREASELVVRAETRSCGNASCSVADFGVHAVRLPRLEGAVRFMVQRNEGLC